jgi:hypothetical protein
VRLRQVALASIVTLSAPFLLGGCGTGPAVRVASHTLTITLDEYRVLPRTVSVPAGRIRIVARNRGILTHNLVLERGTLDSSERSTITTIHTLLPGASDSRTTPPLAPGSYLLVSTVENQSVLGMVGTLIVR